MRERILESVAYVLGFALSLVVTLSALQSPEPQTRQGREASPCAPGYVSGTRLCGIQMQHYQSGRWVAMGNLSPMPRTPRN